MLTTLLLTAALAGQVRTINVPKIVYEIPVVGGQREIVLGVQPHESGRAKRILREGDRTEGLVTPGNPAVMLTQIMPGEPPNYNLGYFDSSIRTDTLFDTLRGHYSNAKWNQKMGRKPNQVTVVT